jgi:tetratricopeptide (TPR) repeat protein/transcriptional regulator with XRE-family HTH domain
VPVGSDQREPPGSWLRRQRESTGLTQEELAERAGLATRTISNLESGRIRRPHPRSLLMLASALDLSPDARSELQARYRPPNGNGANQQQPEASHAAPPPPDERREPAQAAIAVPRQLPLAVAPFVGRSAELGRLDHWLEQARRDTAGPAILAIGGMGGVGKTALALHWAQRVAAEFPGGQLHVSLGDYGHAGRPTDTAEALSGFLTALGAAPERIPTDIADQVSLYRELGTGRRMLIMLDNARDAEQVRALTPGEPGCVVVVTSRRQLADLAVEDGARLLSLDVLTAPEATTLLATRLGADRVHDEPQAIDDLIALCARLPLALVIVAARAAVSGWPLAVLAGQLDDARTRLDAFDLGDSIADLRSVFAWSFRQLSTAAAGMLRLLALHPGPDIASAAAASLAAVPAARAGAILRELAQASLITERAPGRHELHDLLRLYAAEQAAAMWAEPADDGATGRMLDHYLHASATAAHLLDPAGDCPRPGQPRPGVTAEVMTTPDEALAWFGAEHKILMAVLRRAADEGFDDYARQLPHALATFFDRSGRWHDLATSQQIALTCAQRSRDLLAEATAHRLLGRARQRLGDTEIALAHLNRAVELLAPIGDHGELVEQARACLSLSVLYDSMGQLDRSLAISLHARDLAEAAGHLALLAIACNNIGYDYARLGDLDQALEYCLRSIDYKRQVGSPRLEAATWDSLGLVYSLRGDFDQAIASYQRALDLFGQMDARYNQADTLSHLGDTYEAAGDAEQAGETWRQALVILDDLSHADAIAVRHKLHRTRTGADQPASPAP